MCRGLCCGLSHRGSGYTAVGTVKSHIGADVGIVNDTGKGSEQQSGNLIDKKDTHGREDTGDHRGQESDKVFQFSLKDLLQQRKRLDDGENSKDQNDSHNGLADTNDTACPFQKAGRDAVALLTLFKVLRDGICCVIHNVLLYRI